MFAIRSGKGRTVAMCGSLNGAKRRAVRYYQRKGGRYEVRNPDGHTVWVIG